MKEPTPKYTFYRNYDLRDFVVINGKEKAIAYARKFIEADGNHVLMKVVDNGKNIKMQWMEWKDETPTVISKTLGIANKADFVKYEKWLRKEQAKAEAERLKAINAKAKADNEKLLAELKAERLAKQTLAVAWVD